MSDAIQRCRKKAYKAREHAEKSISPIQKESWLRMAEEWLKLAQSVDNRSKPNEALLRLSDGAG